MTDRLLGDYRLIKQIGRGALGLVFLAEHRFTHQQFSIKILPEDLAQDRSFIQRFEEEVRKLAVLEHPNIVKIHNVSHAQGSYFLVTDCVVDEIGEVTNLAHYLSSQRVRLGEEVLLSLLRQVADALDYGHNVTRGEGGLLHGALKLNNVLIRKKGPKGVTIALSDYGLAKIVGFGAMLSRTYAAQAQALALLEPGALALQGQDAYAMEGVDQGKLRTLHGAFLQNISFLAPEQRRPEQRQPIGTSVDTYAFGVLAYYLLTREYPEGIFPLPSEIAPDYTYNWDALIRSCLQRDPAERPTSLLDALDVVEVGEQEEVVQDLQSAFVKEKSAASSTRGSFEFKTARPLSTAVPKPTHVPVAATIGAEGGQNGGGVQTKGEGSSIYPQREVPQVRTYRQEESQARSVEPILTEMVVVPGGTFWRGSQKGNRDEMPCHQVHLDSFAIALHPITNEQFVRFLEYMGDDKDTHNHDLIILRESRIRRRAGKLIIESGYAKHPVVGVTWYGAQAYAAWVGQRLPTEAEWEIAAKGGDEQGIFPTGETIEKNQANFFSSDTTPVKSYPPNGYGLFDIAGNVYEWCQDWYRYNYYELSAQEPSNPRGPLQGEYRVLRGGCWKSLQGDLRSSHRHRNNPGTVNGTYGFRLACDVEEE